MHSRGSHPRLPRTWRPCATSQEGRAERDGLQVGVPVIVSWGWRAPGGRGWRAVSFWLLTGSGKSPSLVKAVPLLASNFLPAVRPLNLQEIPAMAISRPLEQTPNPGGCNTW